MFADAHLHSNPIGGVGAETIAKKFKAIGGWFAALVALPPYHYGISGYPSIESYHKAFELHIRECNRLREAGIKTACFVGLHPAEIDRFERYGVRGEKAFKLIDSVMDLIERLCSNGRIDGIGEIGRQHYKSLPSRIGLAEYAMIRGLEIARDNNCLVHLHLENDGIVTVKTVDKLVELIRVHRSLILFHHASMEVANGSTRLGYTASLPGKYESLAAILPQIKVQGVTIESDYIDDPKRPCVSTCPWDMVDAQKRLLKEGIVDEEFLYIVNIDNVVRFYRVEPP